MTRADVTYSRNARGIAKLRSFSLESDLPPAVVAALDSCYEAILLPETWPQALHRLARSLNAVGCIFYPETPGDLIHVPASTDLRQPLDHFIAGGWHLHDMRAERTWKHARAGQRAVTEHEIASDEERARSAFHHEWCPYWGLPWWAAVAFSVEGRMWGVPLLRSDSQGPFTPDEKQLLERLSPHLGRIVGLAGKLAERQGQAALDLLEGLQSPAVLLDRQGRVVRANASAAALFGKSLRVQSGRLAACDHDSNMPLQAAIDAGAAGVSMAAAPPRTVAIRRPDGRRPLLVKAVSLAGIFRDAFQPAKTLLIFEDADTGRTPSDTVLRGFFGLTQAEARLAGQLGAEQTLAEAADALRISKETARAQLRSIFAKTDTHRQAELVALLGRVCSVPMRN